MMPTYSQRAGGGVRATPLTVAPRPDVTPALARLLYLAHLAIILWWLLDKSPRQRATTRLEALVKQALRASALTLRLPRLRAFVVAGDKLLPEALFDDGATG
jgi:hypothetical protein